MTSNDSAMIRLILLSRSKIELRSSNHRKIHSNFLDHQPYHRYRDPLRVRQNQNRSLRNQTRTIRLVHRLLHFLSILIRRRSRRFQLRSTELDRPTRRSRCPQLAVSTFPLSPILLTPPPLLDPSSIELPAFSELLTATPRFLLNRRHPYRSPTCRRPSSIYSAMRLSSRKCVDSLQLVTLLTESSLRCLSSPHSLTPTR